MKTKSIPVILMLVAGALTCILGFVYQYETTQFFTMVLTVLVIFYMLGCIVKIIIDKNFSAESAKESNQSEETRETKENINSESEENADE
mgnify:CR=1 FL=1